MAKQKFYIVAHNPNTIELAEQFLKTGANALGPDIKFNEGEYYVSHGAPGSNPLTPEHSLRAYLAGIKLLAETGKYNLSLIIFDVKDPVFDINAFCDFVHEHLLKYKACTGIAIVITTAHINNISFLTNYNKGYNNIGIAIDQHPEPEEVLLCFKQNHQTNIAYGNGITSVLPKPGLYKSIAEATWLQTQADSFKLIIVWVLKAESSIKSYLQLKIDAVIVDLEEVALMYDILAQQPYCQQFELAHQGYNPWQTPTIQKII